MAEPITLNLFYSRLNEKISVFNTRLLMQTVMINSGLDKYNKEDVLGDEDAKAICLELIKQGGPAFQVGKDIYARFQ